MPKRDERYRHEYSFGGDYSSDLERPRPVSSRNQDKTLQSPQLTSASPIICLYTFKTSLAAALGKRDVCCFFFQSIQQSKACCIFENVGRVFYQTVHIATSFNGTPAELPIFF